MSSRIHRLKVECFRGIESLTWHPGSSINIILGGGDVGKTTILDAIALLLNPTNTYALTDADYRCRDVNAEFVIEAVMSLPAATTVNQQTKMNWPWAWDGEKPIQPVIGEGNAGSAKTVEEPVYIVRVRGTSDLELVYEIVQPDDTIDVFSVALRRAIGMVRLAGDDRNDRDLRLVQGSGLDRLLADKGLRGRLGKDLARNEVKEHLEDKAKAALSALEKKFVERALPTKLGLGITGGPGISLNALVGLTADKDGVTLPLSNWGAGTRRLAALAIADALQGERPITIVDEIEKGLEPYRQHTLIQRLAESDAQVFVTTHSGTVLGAAKDAGLWYLDAKGSLGRLPHDKIVRHQMADPHTFLARLAIVCEGTTEVGFISVMLERAIGDAVAHGVWATDGGGHEATLGLLEALAEGGLSFASVVDNEGIWPKRWAELRKKLGDLLLQWPNGCLEEYLIPLFDQADLLSLIEDPLGERTGMRLRTLARRLNIGETDFEKIKMVAGDKLTQLTVEAATGAVPEKFANADKRIKNDYKGDAAIWFKSPIGGRELAGKVLRYGVWPKIESDVLKFLNAVRQAVGLPAIKKLLK
ncbi:MAG: ATP-dependent nuclease [Sulfuricaulis sp.]